MWPATWLKRLFGAPARSGEADERSRAVQAFVTARLGRLSMPIELARPDAGGIEARIFAALMSKRFRKKSVSPRQQAGIRESIRRCVARGAPLKLCLPFGGYKLWRFAEAPEADWAELFSIMHYANWLRPVALGYAPGVEFTFASDAIVLERISNIAPPETAAYATSFAALIEFLARFVPNNLVFSYMTFGSLYPPGAFEAELQEWVQESWARNGGKPPALSDPARRGIDLNVRLRPGQADDPEWREKVHIVHHAYYQMRKRSDYLRDPERIIVFPAPLSHENCIPVGSTRASIAKFWVGVGALRQRGGGFVETVLTPSQAAAARFDWVPVAIPGLPQRNFSRLRILTDASGPA